MLSGPSSALLTLAHMRGKPALMVVAWQELDTVDSLSMEVLKKNLLIIHQASNVSQSGFPLPLFFGLPEESKDRAPKRFFPSPFQDQAAIQRVALSLSTSC